MSLVDYVLKLGYKPTEFDEDSKLREYLEKAEELKKIQKEVNDLGRNLDDHYGLFSINPVYDLETTNSYGECESSRKKACSIDFLRDYIKLEDASKNNEYVDVVSYESIKGYVAVEFVYQHFCEKFKNVAESNENLKKLLEEELKTLEESSYEKLLQDVLCHIDARWTNRWTLESITSTIESDSLASIYNGIHEVKNLPSRIEYVCDEIFKVYEEEVVVKQKVEATA